MNKVDIAAINGFLQNELMRRNLDKVTAVEAAKWLEKADLLKNHPNK